MNQSENHPDHNFSSFAIGLTLGVVAALILGTEEGRKLAKDLYKSLPEKYKKLPDSLLTHTSSTPKSFETFISPPPETPHHTTSEFEYPPPPPPTVPLSQPQINRELDS